MADSPTPDPTESAGSALATDLLRRLTGTLAHNLNNRLTGVIGCLEWSLQGIDPASPIADHLRNGLTCAWQAAEMVQRMILFAFRPVVMSNFTLVSLGEVAENAVRRLREMNHPGLSVEVLRATERLAAANAILVQMALEQLVQNALDAMASRGTLTLSVHDEGPHVCLSVRDSGPGLTEHAAAHLYEPFVTTRTAGHLGLGLVLCRDLTASQGGSIDVTWETGKGTTATLRYPSHSEAETLPPASTPPAPPSSGTSWHVI